MKGPHFCGSFCLIIKKWHKKTLFRLLPLAPIGSAARRSFTPLLIHPTAPGAVSAPLPHPQRSLGVRDPEPYRPTLVIPVGRVFEPIGFAPRRIHSGASRLLKNKPTLSTSPPGFMQKNAYFDEAVHRFRAMPSGWERNDTEPLIVQSGRLHCHRKYLSKTEQDAYINRG